MTRRDTVSQVQALWLTVDTNGITGEVFAEKRVAQVPQQLDMVRTEKNTRGSQLTQSCIKVGLGP